MFNNKIGQFEFVVDGTPYPPEQFCFAPFRFGNFVSTAFDREPFRLLNL